MRCGYCYQRGHNKRTCPVLTERLKQRHDAAIEAGQTDSYYIREYQARIAPKGKKVSHQQCGYCSEYGHTRRKCEVLRKDKEWFVVHHNAHLRVAHDYIMSSPVGIGSLFKLDKREYNYNTGDYDVTTSLLVLTGFSVLPQIKQDGFRILATLQHPSKGWSQTVNVRQYVKDPDYASSWRNEPMLLTPSRGVVPSDWIQSQSITFEAASKLDYFKRVGRKHEDRRDWAFNNLDRTREILEKYPPHADDRHDHHGRAKVELERYTPEHNRAELFKDFKSGE
tara:strand:+ start:208 stop:1047 length:840 start_codon:yes stop_codon:yes gene_type:complete